jgi:hypothetical protein
VDVQKRRRSSATQRSKRPVPGAANPMACTFSTLLRLEQQDGAVSKVEIDEVLSLCGGCEFTVTTVHSE